MEKKMNKLTISNTGREGKYCLYEIEYKEKKYQLVNGNMYGDLGYSAWNIIDNNSNDIHALETVNTIADAKAWIKENC